MSIWVPVTAVCIIVIAAVYDVVRFYRVQTVRQDLFRLRDEIYDRVLAGELSMEDDNVRGIVAYLHGLLFVLENWSILAFVRAIKSDDKDAKTEDCEVSWISDPRFESENHRLFILTVKGLRHVSVFICGLVLIITTRNLLHRMAHRMKYNTESHETALV